MQLSICKAIADDPGEEPRLFLYRFAGLQSKSRVTEHTTFGSFCYSRIDFRAGSKGHRERKTCASPCKSGWNSNKGASPEG